MRNLRSLYIRRPVFAAFLAMLWLGLFLLAPGMSSAQDAIAPSLGAGPINYRVGEKLTYNVLFGKFPNAAYVETSVVSRGKLSGQDAIELRSRIKTLGFVSAAFFPYDEERTVFVSPYTGLPLYLSRTEKENLEPKETIGNYLTAPTTYFDLLSLVFKARETGGVGSYPLSEDEHVYTVVFQTSVNETIKTESGTFDTVLSTVQSDYLTARGIKELKINFSIDADHLPVLVRVKTARGEFRASLMAVQLPPPASSAPPITPVPTPIVPATPKPKPTATPYIENQPLLPELGFQIGETLDYSITDRGKRIALMTLKAEERKLFLNEDSLILTATITGVEPGNAVFLPGDAVRAVVDPDTLAPRRVDTVFRGPLRDLNQTITFDRRTGGILFGPGKPVDAPIGTHSILSLLYAMRSFNLRPSKDPNNPVNDTRVAVFWETQPLIFTLRPSNPEEITINGEKVPAQMVSINTGNDKLDKQGFKVWLSVNGRYPLRLGFGSYQAELLIPVLNKTP
jgi:hypothetical protein